LHQFRGDDGQRLDVLSMCRSPFGRLFKSLASNPDNEYRMIDATIVRAHQHSAGARKKTARKRSADRAAG
jgi:hypothetical protein